jgi:hypothetical protein
MLVSRPVSHVYGAHLIRRRVTSASHFSFGGDPCPLGLPLVGLEVEIERFDRFRVRVWLCNVDLGLVGTLPLVSANCFETPIRTAIRRTTKGAKKG